MRILLAVIIALFTVKYACAQSQVFIQTELAREDIAELITTFEKVHYNPYFKISREEFNRLKDDLIRPWSEDSITLKEFMIVGMKLAAVMSGGHSQMDWKNPAILPEIKSHLYVPFTGRLTETGQIMVSSTNHPEIAVGDQVISVNGQEMSALYKECMSYFGGIEAFKNASCERVFPLYLFFNHQLQAPFTIHLNKVDKVVQTEGLSISELATFLNATHSTEDYTFEVLDQQIGLISYNSCTNYKKFDKFLRTTFKRIASEQIDKLIIDIRENGGGDSSLNDLLLSYLTTSPYQQSSGRYWKVSELAKKAYSDNEAYTQIFGKEFMNKYMNTPNQEIIASLEEDYVHPQPVKNFYQGKSCVLIGPNTFSSANFLADAVKTYKITTLIGTATGECTNDFGELLHFTLQNSGSEVFISSTYDLGANGDKSILEPVYPDIDVETDALEFAKKWILAE